LAQDRLLQRGGVAGAQFGAVATAARRRALGLAVGARGFLRGLELVELALRLLGLARGLFPAPADVRELLLALAFHLGAAALALGLLLPLALGQVDLFLAAALLLLALGGLAVGDRLRGRAVLLDRVGLRDAFLRDG